MKNTQIKKETNIIDSTLSMKGSKILNSNVHFSKNFNYENDKISLLSKCSKIKKIKSSKNGKHVTFAREIDVINVECWKKYNYEQTADEDYEGYIEELEKNKKTNSKGGRFRNKTEKATCTCAII